MVYSRNGRLMLLGLGCFACVQTSPISFVARGKGTSSACNKGNRRRMHAGKGCSPCFRVCTWSYEPHSTLTFLAGDFPPIFPALIFSPHLKNGQPAIFTNISTPGLMTSIRPTFNPTRVRSNTRNPLPFSCSKLLRQP